MAKRLLSILFSIAFSFPAIWAIDFSKLNTQNYVYYVKENGTGDGSSWDKALNAAAFNYVLNSARDGATFHIAAGKYVPSLSSDLKVLEGEKRINALFYIRKPITLIGGYPANPTESSVSDPSNPNNKTLFSADVEGDNLSTDYEKNRTDDLYGCLYIYGNNTKPKVKLYGLTFEGTASGYYPFNTPCNAYNCELDVEKCNFNGCLNGISYALSDVNISDCTFEDNKYAFRWTIGNLNLENSTFVNNNYVNIGPTEHYGASGTKDESVKRTVNVSNCTFFNNKTFLCYGKEASECNFTNNTFVMSDTLFVIKSDGDVSLTGNIIYAKEIKYETPADKVTSKYNYLAAKKAINKNYLSETDWTGTSCQFIDAQLDYNGGFTKTVALLYDRLSDDTPLRYPRSICGLIGDQRHMLRADNTCIGAFEKGAKDQAPTIIKLAEDTTIAGIPYRSKVYYKIGKNNIIDTIRSKTGKDSILYTQTLWVFPNIKNTDFYVTKNGSGNQSGNSWKNAINDTSFAFAISKARDGVTFHIAEGIYHPMYDYSGNEALNNLDRMFATKSAINLIGGYSKNDSTLTPDASKFKTILSGDLDENNSNLYYEYQNDDVKQLLVFKLLDKGSSKISNIYFEGSQITMMQDALIYVDDDYIKEDSAIIFNLKIDSCQFRNSTNFITTEQSTAEINNCLFKGHPDLTPSIRISAPFIGTTTIRNSTFDNVSLNIDGLNSVLTNNTLYNLTIYNNAISESNSKIYHNTITGSCSINNGPCLLAANILTGLFETYPYTRVEMEHNLFNINAVKSINIGGATDRFVEEDVLMSILDNKNGKLLLNDNGGFTPTIAIISDDLPNGKSIRIPLAETDCKYDQRGIERYSYTCPGAVEGDCRDKEVYKDTLEQIAIDNIYFGECFETTGIHIYKENLMSLCGADSIVYHNVLVGPSLAKKEYYVKPERHGRGDGSSWENAMNDTMFSYVLTNHKSKATFHIAEGTYVPYFDGILLDTISSQRSFHVYKPTKIIGGYSKDITDEKEVPNPTKYTTTFTSEVKNQGGTADFTYNLLQFYSSKGDTSTVSGITFSLLSNDPLNGEGLLGSASDCILSIDHCTFKDAPEAICTNGNVSISHSRFINNSRSFHIFMHPQKIEINACEFNNNLSTDAHLDSCFSMSNCTFFGGELSIDAPIVRLHNNTLLADSVEITKAVKSKIVGNIIENIKCDEDVLKNCKYNLSTIDLGEANFVTDDLGEVLFYDYGKKSYILTNEGYFTNAIQIVNYTLSNEETIKFSLEETEVAVDQWGRKRQHNTCVGALESLELDCEIVETIADKVDTILCGSSIYGETYTKEGEFTASERLYTSQGCDSIIIHKIVVLTPTNVEDIISDIDGSDELFKTGQEVFIYNTQGHLLFHSHNGWDGTINGKPVPLGIYIYLIHANDGSRKSGIVELKQSR